MSIEGQGHFFTIYFPGFVCFVLYLAKISGERLQDHWSSGLNIPSSSPKYVMIVLGLETRLVGFAVYSILILTYKACIHEYKSCKM